MRGFEPLIQEDYTDSADFKNPWNPFIRVNLRFKAFTVLYAGKKFFLYILQKKIMRGFEPLIQEDYTDSADFKNPW